jgi:hypothetical protein
MRPCSAPGRSSAGRGSVTVGGRRPGSSLHLTRAGVIPPVAGGPLPIRGRRDRRFMIRDRDAKFSVPFDRWRRPSRRGGITHRQIGNIAMITRGPLPAPKFFLVLVYAQLALLLLDPSGKPWIQRRPQDDEEEQRRIKCYEQPDQNRGFQQQPRPQSQTPKQQYAWRSDSRDRSTKSRYRQDDTDDGNDKSYRRAYERRGGDIANCQRGIIANQPHAYRRRYGKQDCDPKRPGAVCSSRARLSVHVTFLHVRHALASMNEATLPLDPPPGQGITSRPRRPCRPCRRPGVCSRGTPVC